MGPWVPELHKSQVAACIPAPVPSGYFRAGDNPRGPCVVAEAAGEPPPEAAVGRCFEEG